MSQSSPPMSRTGHLQFSFGGETNGDNDKTLLARLGYKQELKREFTIVELFGFGFSVNAVVPSIAATLFYSMPNGGPTAMIWGWATSSVFIMFIALAMAELGSAAPTSGGIYYWTYKFCSPRYRNLMCWMVGYTNTISYIAGVAGLNWTCATVIMAGASIGSDGRFVPTQHQTFGVFCAVLISQASIASCATRVIARLQNALIVLNIALVLIIIIGLPIATPAEFKNTAKYAFGAFENATPWPNGFTFILGFLAPLWAISGFDVGVHISEEAKNANVAVPWAIVIGTLAGCILGFPVQIALAFYMGTDIDAILSSPVQQPLGTIILNSFGKKGTLAIWSFLLVALYGAATSLLTSSSRQTFAFSRDGALVFSKFLYKINSFTGTPVRCVWFSATIAAALTLLTFAGPAATGAIFSLGVIGQYIGNSVPIAARYLGGQQFEKGPFYLGRFSKPVAGIALLWMSFMTLVLLFPTAPNPNAPDWNYTVVVLAGVFSIALGYYYFPVFGGRHWFGGPVSTVETENEEKLSS